MLIVLDKADLKSRIEQAQAAETSAKAKYDHAEIELGRAQRLKSRESITQSELDQANTDFKTAKADLARAQRAVEEARIVEAYATVRAPITGRIVDKKVNAGDTVSPGQALVAMYDPSHMQLIATVRESLALRLKVGQEIAARIDTLGYDCHATISEIVPEAQAESRSFQVKVTGPCPPNIYSGMFGRIFFPLEDEDVLVVPPKAIRQVGQLDEVDVIEGNSVEPSGRSARPDARRGPRGALGLERGREGRSAPGSQSHGREGPVMNQQDTGHADGEPKRHDFLNGIVHIFLDNNFSIILIVVSVLIGLAALLVTPREEEPQIVVPLADGDRRALFRSRSEPAAN